MRLLLLLLLTLSASAATTTWERAVQRDELAVIRDQLDSIGDIDRTTGRGKTALMAAARAGDPVLTERLLRAGADPAAANRQGGTVLMYAVVGGSPAIAARLLEAGADPQARSRNGWTALMMAAAKNRPAIARRLLEAGADPDRADIYGWTPLMRAVYAGHAAVAGVLLNRSRPDLTRVNDQGQTVLHLAVIQGRTALVQTLLARGARQTADFAGRTPRSIARSLQRPDLLALLDDAQH